MHVSAIIAAGGRGRRLGASVPKQLLRLRGRTMLQWTLDAFLSCERVSDVVVVVPPELAVDPPEYLRVPRVSVIAGGERRQDSVAMGFDAVPPEADVVLVHDAARPFVDSGTLGRSIDAAAEAGGAIAAVAASDTVKWSPEAGAGGVGPRVIERTLSRGSVFLAQTPQAFRRSVLADAVALGRSGVEATDEAALAEQAGHAVVLVEGSRRNLKITTPEDLVIAEALLETDDRRAEALLHGSRRDTVLRQTPDGSAEAGADRRWAPGGAASDPRDGGATQRWGRPSGLPVLRVGSGYDLHRLVEGRRLVLGGVEVPFDRGLSGHSDADVLCHALTDAILGAASIGDIGQHFPDTDPRWEGASSLDLLTRVVALVGERGYSVINADATVIAERPKLGPFRAAIVDRLSSALSVPAERISVKAKTNEGVDAAGRGEAIAVHAVVLLTLPTPDS